VTVSVRAAGGLLVLAALVVPSVAQAAVTQSSITTPADPYYALWNEQVAKLEPGEDTDKWRNEVQAIIEAEAKEAQKPYIAPVVPGRNDPCHCGSGKKFKKCHGA